MHLPIKEKIRELEKQTRLLTENIVDVIFVLDPKTLMYEYLTESVERISGYRAEDLINTRFVDRLEPESARRANDILQAELANFHEGTHLARSLELEIKHRNGGTYWVEMKAKLLKEPDDIMKIVGIARDITERKQAEQQLASQNTELEKALAEKERLLKEIKILQKLLPLCSGCRRIRDKEGKWWPLDIYVSNHTDSSFTHTICPDCKDVFYPESKGI